MKQRTFNLEGGLSYVLTVPSTVAEYVSLSKQSEAELVDDAVSERVYRGPQADVREALCDAIEAAFPDTPRNRTAHATRKNSKGEAVQVEESASRYIARVAAAANVEVKSFQSMLDEIMTRNEMIAAGDPAKIELDLTKYESKGRKPAVAKGDLEYADAFIAIRESDPARFAQKIEELEAFIGRTVPVDGSREVLASAIKDFRVKSDEIEKARRKAALLG